MCLKDHSNVRLLQGLLKKQAESFKDDIFIRRYSEIDAMDSSSITDRKKEMFKTSGR